MSDGLRGIQEPFTYHRQPRGLITAEVRARVVALHQEGEPFWQIAQAVDLSPHTVRKLITEARRSSGDA